jgi:hypothetical protein
MPKPKTKIQIVEKLDTERRRLEHNISLLTQEQMVQAGVVGDWSVKDVLAHLADWEAHMPVWIEAARTGDPVVEIETGIKWGQYDEFNQRIFQRHRAQSLEEVLKYFRDTHQEFMNMVEAMPDDELHTQGRYGFIGKGAVYNWL